MKITLKILIAFLIPLLVFTTLTCALSVNSVSVDKVSPGEDGIIKVNVENDGNRDIDFLSFNIEFPEDKIIPIGSSSASLNELKEDDDETFAFRFKVANNLAAGTYSLSYLINYEENNAKREQKGTIGIVVSAEPELEVTADIESPIIGQQGTLNIRVVNKGLADARFVSLSIESDDITFLGERSEYIGTIDSDDIESVSFDIIPTTRRPDLSVRIEYKDFEKLDIRIGTVKEVNPHPNADKLYVLKIQFDKEPDRQIIAGIKNYYKPEEILGKQVAVIVNLKPATLRGVESNGMLMPAHNDEGHVVVLTSEKTVDNFSKIH